MNPLTLPWGVEETPRGLYVGSLLRDGSGKIHIIVFTLDIEGVLSSVLDEKRKIAHHICGCHNNWLDVEQALARFDEQEKQP